MLVILKRDNEEVNEQAAQLIAGAIRKKPALTRMCDARRGQGELPFESDFGTSDILAAVDRNCISPVRD